MRFSSFVSAALVALAPLAAASNLTQLVARDQVVPRVGSGVKMVRGVNLGSWFVLEPWMIPHVFTPALKAKGAVDQWTYMKAFNDDAAALAALQQHWSTWIVEDDFKQIAAAGLNTVRLPIPHWLWKSAGSEKEPYLVGAELPYIDQAIRWAAQYGIEVMLDMHTSPGSQNGWDHSGRLGPINLPKDPQNSNRLIFALEQSVKRWVNDPGFGNAVTSIQVLNEPASFKEGMPKSFYLPLYRRAFDAIRAAVSPTAGVIPTVVLHDTFSPLADWDAEFANTKQWPVGTFAQDTHRYQKFGDYYRTFTFDRHIAVTCAMGKEFAAAQAKRPLVEAEWHLGIWCDGCAYSTMQQSINSMNNATQNLFYRRFWEAQANMMERNGGGWVFWNWKTVSAAHASYKDAMVQGWIPKLASDRAYKVDAQGCPTKELIQPLTFATQSNPPTPVVAPNGYRISWAIDGKRSSFAASTGYISRFTVGATWSGNDQASACAARCEQTNGCAMGELIRYNGGAEGQAVCALYKTYQATSTATYATGPNNSGTVIKSYAIRRNAGAVVKRSQAFSS